MERSIERGKDLMLDVLEEWCQTEVDYCPTGVMTGAIGAILGACIGNLPNRDDVFQVIADGLELGQAMDDVVKGGDDA